MNKTILLVILACFFLKASAYVRVQDIECSGFERGMWKMENTAVTLIKDKHDHLAYKTAKCRLSFNAETSHMAQFLTVEENLIIVPKSWSYNPNIQDKEGQKIRELFNKSVRFINNGKGLVTLFDANDKKTMDLRLVMPF